MFGLPHHNHRQQLLKHTHTYSYTVPSSSNLVWTNIHHLPYFLDISFPKLFNSLSLPTYLNFTSSGLFYIILVQCDWFSGWLMAQFLPQAGFFSSPCLEQCKISRQNLLDCSDSWKARPLKCLKTWHHLPSDRVPHPRWPQLHCCKSLSHPWQLL